MGKDKGSINKILLNDALMIQKAKKFSYRPQMNNFMSGDTSTPVKYILALLTPLTNHFPLGLRWVV